MEGGILQPKPRRKGSHACDPCRQKKRRCDRSARTQDAKSVLEYPHSGSVLDVPCWNCVKSGAKCTYGVHKLTKSCPKVYVELLEKRLDNLGSLLQRLCISPELRKEIDALLNVSPWQSNSSSITPCSNMDHQDGGKSPTNVRASIPGCLSNTDDVASRMERNYQHPINDLKTEPIARGSEFHSDVAGGFLSGERFTGESSVLNLICTTLPLKQYRDTTSDDIHDTSTVRDSPIATGIPKRILTSVSATYRPAIADTPGSYNEAHSLLFPPRDLLMNLVDLYFTHINIVWPLLHENAFRSDVLHHRYLKCQDLGYVVLAVCAVASRYCKDRRVLAKVSTGSCRTGAHGSSYSGEECLAWLDDREEASGTSVSDYDDAPLCSAGWKYHSRIRRDLDNVMAPVKLTELQTVFLTQQFLFGMPDFTAGWVTVGAAIRRAQDRGVHRGEMYGTPDLETELWKRAFWCLVIVDRFASARFGRSSCIKHEDMDIDFPLDIDDEYWSSPDENGICVPLEQPPDMPSTMTAFNALIKLSFIYSWAQRTLYVFHKRKDGISAPGGTTQEIVDRLNEDLDEWIKSVPLHLKWSPSQSNPVWRTQSANLYITYYILRIQIYQCFLPTATSLPPCLGVCSQAYRFLQVDKFPPLIALDICAHAARSMGHILEDILSHISQDDDAFLEIRDVPTLLIGTFTPAITLFIVQTTKGNIGSYGDPHTDSEVPDIDWISQESDEEIFEVFLETFRRAQTRWPRAARGLEIIRSAISLSTKTIAATRDGKPWSGNSQPASVKSSQDFFSWPQSQGTPAVDSDCSSSSIQPFSWIPSAYPTSTSSDQHTAQLQRHAACYSSQNSREKPLEEKLDIQKSSRYETTLASRPVIPPSHFPPRHPCIPNTMDQLQQEIPRPQITTSSECAPGLRAWSIAASSNEEDISQMTPQRPSGLYDQNPFWFANCSWD